jgi:hypothetical protein
VTKSIILPIFIAAIFIASCTYHNEETEYPTPEGCDTTDMSYTTDIIPMLNLQGCTGCHGSSATTKLDTYDNTKISVDNGSLIGSINHESGFRAMPDSRPKLDQCTIDKIASWIANGAPNN